MKRSTVPLLACPARSGTSRCGGILSLRALDSLLVRSASHDADEVLEGGLTCGSCGAEYPLLSGVAILHPEPINYLRRYKDAIRRDIERHGWLSPEALGWFARRTVRAPEQQDYGADFRFSQQFEEPAEIARALSPEPEALYGPFAGILSGQQGGGPYNLLASWAAELPGERRLLLDAGCGGGGLLARAARGFQAAFGVDLSFLAVLLARRTVLHRPERERSYLLGVRRGYEVERPLNVPPLENGEIVVGDCTAVPFSERLFDVVLSCNVIDIAGIDGPLDEASRVLGSGGRLLLSDPFFWREGEAPEGEPKEVVRRALERRGLKIETEQDAVPWAWATYDRHWHLYFNFCVAARRA